MTCRSLRTVGALTAHALLLLAAVVAAPATAEDWLNYGPQGQGMGGAGTAHITGPMAPLWNPANLRHFRAGVDEERDVGISTGAFTDFSVSFAALALEFDAVGDVIVRGDALYQTLDWVANSPQYDELGVWLFNPNVPATVNLSNELTAAFASVALLSSMNLPGEGLTFDGSGGMDFQIGQFGLHFGATEWSSAHPAIAYNNLDISGGTPFDLANGLDREFGANSLAFPFLPSTLTLDAGGQALALDFLNAGVVGNTTTSNYSAAELLAYFYQASAAEAGLSLAGAQTREGIILITTAPGLPSAFPGGGTDPFANNDSAIRLHGVVVFDIAASFGAAVVDDRNFSFQFGVTARVLYARTYYQDVRFSDLENDIDQVLEFWQDIIEAPFDSNAVEQFQPTFDIGVTLTFFDRRLRVAAVGRNLIEPELEVSGGSSVRIPAAFRAGVAFDIIENMLTVATDIDITRTTRDTLPGLSSRELAFGVEFKPLAWAGIADTFGLALRAGAVANLMLEEPVWALTAGIGLRLFIVQLDVFGGISLDTLATRATSGGRPWSDYGSTFGTVPARASLGVSLSFGLSW